jgi:chemotaxis protein methyltransferase CheR
MLRRDTAGDQELANVIDEITTNETYFFRERNQLRALFEEILPRLRMRREAEGGSLLSIWSAGCSSGEEPYTLAILLMTAFPGEDLSQVKIYASDLNTRVLSQAELGIYPLSRVEPLAPEWRQRFFQKGVGQRQGFVRVKAEVRRLVNFFRFNLMDQLPFREELDIIFCRNVMIYFEKETQVKLVNKFYDCLRPGGYLFIGHSESLCNHRHQFSYVKPTIYRK